MTRANQAEMGKAFCTIILECRRGDAGYMYVEQLEGRLPLAKGFFLQRELVGEEIWHFVPKTF